MNKKRYLFIADDNKIQDVSVWRSEDFEAPILFENLNYQTRSELLRKADELALKSLVYLITDADFAFEHKFDRRYGGGRLAREFLSNRSADCRAVIYSDEPLAAIGYENDPRVWAAKKNHAPEEILRFLIYGVRPQIPECLDFLRRVAAFRQGLDLAIDRPLEAMDRIVEALAGGFGESVPEPYTRRTFAFFDASVAMYMRNRCLSSKSEFADEWKLFREILHPYCALEIAASDSFSAGAGHGGNFFLLWHLSKSHRKIDLMLSDLESDETDFPPREIEWIRRQRRKLKARLLHQFPSGTSQAELLSFVKAARSDLIVIENLLAEVDEE